MAPPDAQPTLSRPFSIGERIERRYALESLLHEESGWSLFTARDLQRQRAVILQSLPLGPNPLAQPALARTVQSLAELAHPNIAAIVDHGALPSAASDERGFVVYESLEGETLHERMARGPIASDAALLVVRQLLAALASMHAVGLIHGGVRPSCVFLQRRKHGLERIRLQGFRFGYSGGSQGSRYDAPELVRGQRPDPRTDVYAVGVLLSELWPELAGRPIDDEPCLRVPSLEATLPRMIACATAAQPEQRFSNAAEMLCGLIDALPSVPARAQEGARDSARPPPLPAATTARPSVPPPRASVPPVRASVAPAAAIESAPEPAFSPEASPTAARTIDQDAAPLPRVRRSVPPSTSISPLTAARPPARSLRPPTAAVMLGFLGLAVLAVAAMESDRLHTVAKAPPKHPKTPVATLSDAVETDLRAASDRHDDWHSLPIVPTPHSPPTIEPSAPLAPAKEREASTTAAAPPPSAAGVRKHAIHRMDARDPWLQPVPSALQGLPAYVRTGQPGSEATLTALRDYNYKNPGDPRGFLLLGKLYCNRLWRTDCVNEWSSALRRDPSARGAPDLLPALLQLVAQGKAADPAADLIAMAYGREALSEIEAALPALRNSEPAARLHALAARIEAEE